MPLFAINTDGSDIRIVRIPHLADFEAWCARLQDLDYQAIVRELNDRIEANGEVHTSSWIPGSDWGGTPFWPIYEIACARDQDAAARFFGLILWKVMIDRPEDWSFGRYEKDGAPIEGMTYFRVHTGSSSP